MKNKSYYSNIDTKGSHMINGIETKEKKDENIYNISSNGNINANKEKSKLNKDICMEINDIVLNKKLNTEHTNQSKKQKLNTNIEIGNKSDSSNFI